MGSDPFAVARTAAEKRKATTAVPDSDAKMKLAAAPGDTEATTARILAYQRPPVQTLIANIESRLPVPDILLKLKKVFDFNQMELTNEDAGAFEILQTHGDAEIDWLVENFFPMLDAETLKSQSLAVKIFVKENHARFYNADEAETTWTLKRRTRHVPKPGLRIAGKGSILEALFCTPGIIALPIEQYLHIADFMIAFDIKSADVERVGSHMQLIKTKLRTSLADQTFKSLVFLSFNLPHLHEIDVDILVKSWKAAGHRLPITREDADSIVLRRMRNDESQTFFLKKGSRFHPSNFKFLKDRAFEGLESDSSSESSSESDGVGDGGSDDGDEISGGGDDISGGGGGGGDGDGGDSS